MVYQVFLCDHYPTSIWLSLNPRPISIFFTFSLCSPCSSIFPSLNVPPQANFDLRALATSFGFASWFIPSTIVTFFPNALFTVYTFIFADSIAIVWHTQISFGKPHILHTTTYFLLLTFSVNNFAIVLLCSLNF